MTIAEETGIRVVVGEDSYIAREGIIRALEGLENVEIVATCVDLESLRAAIPDARPDVVLTDIRMPPSGTDEGIQLANELRSSHPDVGVILLSQHAEPMYAIALFESGSDRRGYLLKERLKDRGELYRALREVADGGSLVDSRIVEELILSPARDADSQFAKLTPREREILAMIAEGRSNTAIAQTLMITKRAVERHINGIFVKLDIGESEDVNRRVKATLVYLARQAD